MATIQKQGYTTVDLSGFIKHIKGMEAIQQTLGQNIARKLQLNGFEAMQNQFYVTAKNVSRRYHRKGKRYSLEYRLFSKNLPDPVRIDEDTYLIVVVEDFERLQREVPHLEWQESGTRATVDRQPYRILPNGKLGPITKVKAARMRSRKMGDLPRQIKILNVPHPALKARNFLLAAQRAIKFNSEKIVIGQFKQQLKEQGIL